MNRDDFQILRFEIQGLAKKFAAQIIPRADELDAAITKAFEDIAANGQLQRVVEDAALDALKDAVRAVMESWEVRDAMKKKCLAALDIKERTRA